MIPRQILHVDMDAFYAAVEQRDRPELRGKAVLVGGSAAGRGVVAAASYEARAFGPRSAMPMATALRLCPHAVVVPVRMARYREVSRQVFRIFDEFSPLVEPLSIDEAFLDLTGTERLFGSAEQAARRLKERIRAETGLAASIGVAPSKFLAKLASDLRKPDGLMVIAPDQVQAILDPLPVERLWGVGAATLRRFEKLGVKRVADVRRLPLERLVREFGVAGEQFFHLARGEDERPVSPDHQTKSISHEVTFPEDVGDVEILRTVLLHQVEDVGYRLRRLDLYSRTVTLKLRYPDFTTITRATTLAEATQATGRLWKAAAEVFDEWAQERPAPLRLIGMGAGNLCEADGRQLSLFSETDDKQRRLDTALDKLRARFGPNAVRRSGAGSSPRRGEGNSPRRHGDTEGYTERI
jgi:DNA polymerase IV